MIDLDDTFAVMAPGSFGSPYDWNVPTSAHQYPILDICNLSSMALKRRSLSLTSPIRSASMNRDSVVSTAILRV